MDLIPPSIMVCQNAACLARLSEPFAVAEVREICVVCIDPEFKNGVGSVCKHPCPPVKGT